ncbi:MAG TPA: glycosyl transferase, partial [Cyanobacteria bacterium UBA11049]|nr:glycosyl transferase [Cyanobacteria bacterium UBA11049]
GMLKLDVPLDLVLATAEGPYLDQIPKQVRVVDLRAGRAINATLPLSLYLQQNKPSALLSHLNHANVVAIVARELARTKTRLVVVEHDTLSVARTQLIRGKLVPTLVRWLYPRADAIVGVSKGTMRDLQVNFGIAGEKLSTIYNPVVNDELLAKAQAPLDHPWFQPEAPPVFLGVGRLSQQKDFWTLIEAFSLLRKQRMARLIILGEGECRTQLEATIARLGITEDVSLPGFVKNPYAYMSRARAFILSSRWEALPTVLIEAMACGCPIISTNCPSGPEEILESGVYGTLVPIADATALSKSMLQMLDAPKNRNLLIQRATNFSFERAVNEYLELLGYR